MPEGDETAPGKLAESLVKFYEKVEIVPFSKIQVDSYFN